MLVIVHSRLSQPYHSRPVASLMMSNSFVRACNGNCFRARKWTEPHPSLIQHHIETSQPLFKSISSMASYCTFCLPSCSSSLSSTSAHHSQHAIGLSRSCQLFLSMRWLSSCGHPPLLRLFTIASSLCGAMPQSHLFAIDEMLYNAFSDLMFLSLHRSRYLHSLSTCLPIHIQTYTHNTTCPHTDNSQK